MPNNKIEIRAEHLRELAAGFAALMEQNEALGQLIEQAIESDDDEDKYLTCVAVEEFQRSVASVIGGLAVVTTNITNSSASMFLGELAGMMVETEMECDPLTLLRGLLGGQ